MKPETYTIPISELRAGHLLWVSDATQLGGVLYTVQACKRSRTCYSVAIRQGNTKSILKVPFGEEVKIKK